VTGVPTTIGSQAAIVMSDINAAGGLEAHAPEMKASKPRSSRKP
jgi:hypothetical protein